MNIIKKIDYDFLEKYLYPFCQSYKEEITIKHKLWRKTNEEKDAMFCAAMFLNTNCIFDTIKFPRIYLDMRYLIIDDERKILAINPVIEEIFKDIYFNDKTQPLEDMINKYYDIMNGSIFGGLFEAYMILKFQNQQFELFDEHIMIKDLIKFDFEWKKVNKNQAVKEIIVYDEENFKTTKNVLLKPKSQRFPWVDFDCLTNSEQIIIQCKTGSVINTNQLKINDDKSLEEFEKMIQSLNKLHNFGK